MNKKLYNSEVRGLAIQLFVANNGEHTFYGDGFPKACIIRAKNMINELEMEGYYDEEDPQELSEEDKKIKQELNKVITREMFPTMVYNTVRYRIISMLDIPEGLVTIGDIIKIGCHEMRKAHHMGKKGMEIITEYLEQHNLSWNMDLNKYGL